MPETKKEIDVSVEITSRCGKAIVIDVYFFLDNSRPNQVTTQIDRKMYDVADSLRPLFESASETVRLGDFGDVVYRKKVDSSSIDRSTAMLTPLRHLEYKREKFD